MTKGQHIRVFDYVNHPYEKVRDALKANAVQAFNRATRGAATRADALASQLHVNIAGIDVGKDIAISTPDVVETPGVGRNPPVTRLRFEWKATESPGLFPLMHAELAVYPLTARETQLDFSGTYEPPLGLLGTALDAVAGNRIADASVHQFVSEVAEYLRSTLGS
jgi:hypothetical protein